jgi:hypothetical protein
MIIRQVLVVLFLSIPGLLVAQEKKLQPALSGTAMMATDGNAVYVNLGGPGLKWVQGHWQLSINMLPSLRFVSDKPRPFATPSLGAGFLIAYKRFVIGVPFYYIASRQEWRVAPGVGVRFGK